jgi:nicotinamide riboside kinase
LKTIVITGPESTGKTLISAYLSEKLVCPWIPEYARDYVGRLDRPYTYEDVEHIADIQIKQKNEIERSGASMVILDTWLIITKIWFLEVFGKVPLRIDKEMVKHKIDLFLVCKPDIPWMPDPLRENGGAMREYLMNRYIDEIKKTGWKFVLIGGIGDVRYQNALLAIESHFKLPL